MYQDGAGWVVWFGLVVQSVEGGGEIQFGEWGIAHAALGIQAGSTKFSGGGPPIRKKVCGKR